MEKKREIDHKKGEPMISKQKTLSGERHNVTVITVLLPLCIICFFTGTCSL